MTLHFLPSLGCRQQLIFNILRCIEGCLEYRQLLIPVQPVATLWRLQCRKSFTSKNSQQGNRKSFASKNSQEGKRNNFRLMHLTSNVGWCRKPFAISKLQADPNLVFSLMSIEASSGQKWWHSSDIRGSFSPAEWWKFGVKLGAGFAPRWSHKHMRFIQLLFRCVDCCGWDQRQCSRRMHGLNTRPKVKCPLGSRVGFSG